MTIPWAPSELFLLATALAKTLREIKSVCTACISTLLERSAGDGHIRPPPARMPQVPTDMFINGVMEAIRRNREFVPAYGILDDWQADRFAQQVLRLICFKHWQSCARKQCLTLCAAVAIRKRTNVGLGSVGW